MKSTIFDCIKFLCSLHFVNRIYQILRHLSDSIKVFRKASLRCDALFYFSESPVVNGTRSASLSPVSPTEPTSPFSVQKPSSPTRERTSYVEANVVIQPQTKEPEAAPDGIAESPPAALPAEPEETRLDQEPEDDQDPVPVINLKNQIQKLLNNFAGTNDELLNRHQLFDNTRVKLLQAVDNWFNGREKNKARVAVISGPHGMGKTCVAAEICRKNAEHLAGYHFFDRCTPNIGQNNLRSVILSLAHHFCDVFPYYIGTLPGLQKIKEILAHGDVTDIYDTFVFNPLTNPGLKHPDYEPKLIVLDAIDQCDHIYMNNLVEILQTLNENAPKWLHVLITTVNNNELLSKLDHVHAFEMKRSNDNLVDIKRYLKEPLGKYMDRISLDGGLTQLAKKTGGLFLAADMLSKQLGSYPADTTIAMRQVDQMFPSGFSDICKEVFTKYKDELSSMNLGQHRNSAYTIILSILLNIREPIHKNFVIDALGLPVGSDSDSILRGLAPVLCEFEGKVHLSNPALCEWLVHPSIAESCAVDLETGQDKLAELCLLWLQDLLDDNRRLGTNCLKIQITSGSDRSCKTSQQN